MGILAACPGRFSQVVVGGRRRRPRPPQSLGQDLHAGGLELISAWAVLPRPRAASARDPCAHTAGVQKERLTDVDVADLVPQPVRRWPAPGRKSCQPRPVFPASGTGSPAGPGCPTRTRACFDRRRSPPGIHAQPGPGPARPRRCGPRSTSSAGWFRVHRRPPASAWPPRCSGPPGAVLLVAVGDRQVQRPARRGRRRVLCPRQGDCPLIVGDCLGPVSRQQVIVGQRTQPVLQATRSERLQRRHGRFSSTPWTRLQIAQAGVPRSRCSSVGRRPGRWPSPSGFGQRTFQARQGDRTAICTVPRSRKPHRFSAATASADDRRPGRRPAGRWRRPRPRPPRCPGAPPVATGSPGRGRGRPSACRRKSRRPVSRRSARRCRPDARPVPRAPCGSGPRARRRPQARGAPPRPAAVPARVRRARGRYPPPAGGPATPGRVCARANRQI